MVEVFGQADKNKDGKVKSTYPAYYFRQQMEDLEESIKQREYSISNDLVQGTEKMVQKERLKQEQDRLTQIQDSKPKLTGDEMDGIAKIRKSLGGKIKELMFSRSQMDRGLADAHEEARRMSSPCLLLDEKEIEFVKACDVFISCDGKVTRTGAEKAWKISSRLIDEGSNTEELRKP